MPLTRRSEKLTDAEQTLLLRIRNHYLERTILGTLAQNFSSVLRSKDVAALQPWLESVAGTGLPDMKTFCEGPLRYVEAVKAAISMRWSNGPVEGHVHRLKLIKSQMYGSSSFNLLRARVLRFYHVLLTPHNKPVEQHGTCGRTQIRLPNSVGSIAVHPQPTDLQPVPLMDMDFAVIRRAYLGQWNVTDFVNNDQVVAAPTSHDPTQLELILSFSFDQLIYQTGRRGERNSPFLPAGCYTQARYQLCSSCAAFAD
jgi:hypothetical protein